MNNKEAIKILNDALNLANSKGVFGTLQNSTVVSTAFSILLSNFKQEVEDINKELAGGQPEDETKMDEVLHSVKEK